MSVLGNLRSMKTVWHDQKTQQRCVVGRSSNKIKMSRRNIFEKSNSFSRISVSYTSFITFTVKTGERKKEKNAATWSNGFLCGDFAFVPLSIIPQQIV